MNYLNLSFFRLLFVSLFVFQFSVITWADSQLFDDDDVQSGSGLTYRESAILGVVEGLTEYLPVSSTGHLILTDRLLDKQKQEEFVSAGKNLEARNAYLIVIQGGAILAVLFIYWEKVWSIFMGLLGRNPKGLALGLKVLVAFIPAALSGPFLNDFIESKLFNPIAVSIALAVGAIVMIVVELRRKKSDSGFEGEMEELTFKSSLAIGLMQCLAMWPGMSRSMVTIVGGYFVGLNAKAAAEFSFLLGLVTLSAASMYSLMGSWEVITTQIEMGPAVWGILVATVVAFVAVKWFVGFLAKHGLIAFAIYRLLLACVILWVFGV